MRLLFSMYLGAFLCLPLSFQVYLEKFLRFSNIILDLFEFVCFLIYNKTGLSLELALIACIIPRNSNDIANDRRSLRRTVRIKIHFFLYNIKYQRKSRSHVIIFYAWKREDHLYSFFSQRGYYV